MKLFDFLNSLYVTGNREMREEHTAYRHAKTLATQDLISAQRKFFKFISYFQLLGHYLAIKLHLVSPPESAEKILTEHIKNQMRDIQ